MPRKFNCHKCGGEIIIEYLKPGETAKCQKCGTGNVVSDKVLEVPASQENNKNEAENNKNEAKKKPLVFDKPLTDLWQYLSEFSGKCDKYEQSRTPPEREVFETDDEYARRCPPAESSFPIETIYFACPVTLNVDYSHDSQSLVLKWKLDAETDYNEKLTGKSYIYLNSNESSSTSTYRNVFGAVFEVNEKYSTSYRLRFNTPISEKSVQMDRDTAREQARNLSLILGMRFVFSPKHCDSFYHSGENDASFDNRSVSSFSLCTIDAELSALYVINTETKTILAACDCPEDALAKTSNFSLYIILATFLFWGLGIWFRDKNSPDIYSPQKTTAEPTSSSVQKTGRLIWTKPDRFKGNIPSERSLSMNTVVVRDDAEVMALTSGPAHFHWDKREKYGKWYQDNSDATGKWYLLPTNNPKIYKGEVSDNEVNFVALRLEIN